jgi:hypothetical protein
MAGACYCYNRASKWYELEIDVIRYDLSNLEDTLGCNNCLAKDLYCTIKKEELYPEKITTLTVF